MRLPEDDAQSPFTIGKISPRNIQNIVDPPNQIHAKICATR